MKRLKPMWRIETDPSTAGSEGGSGGKEPKDESFTQADVDRIVADRLKREREAVKAKYADYDDLKAKAEGAKTTEDRVAELEGKLAESAHAALKARIQAKHGISDDDAALFLTGADEAALEAQAKRLAERESDRKRNNNVSPREGTENPVGEGKDAALRDFTRNLFSQAQADD